MGKVAVRQADLPDHITERAGEQPPEDFPFDQWREHRRVGGVVEQRTTVDGETSAVCARSEY
jgi:hypothetical protein